MCWVIKLGIDFKHLKMFLTLTSRLSLSKKKRICALDVYEKSYRKCLQKTIWLFNKCTLWREAYLNRPMLVNVLKLSIIKVYAI